MARPLRRHARGSGLLLTFFLGLSTACLCSCGMFVRWPAAVEAVGWSHDNNPVVVERVPTGHEFYGHEGWPFLSRPSGRHYDVRRPAEATRSFVLPTLDVYSMRVLDEDTLLVLWAKDENVFAGRYRINANGWERTTAVALPDSSNKARLALVSTDLNYLAFSTQAGVLLINTSTKVSKTLIPGFRVGEIRFSEDNTRLAALVASTAEHIRSLELGSVFTSMPLRQGPASKAGLTEFQLGCVVIDLVSGQVVEAKSAPGKINSNFFLDSAYESPGYRMFHRVPWWPFFFDLNGRLQVTEIGPEQTDYQIFYGPYLSPDGRSIGFWHRGKNIEWEDSVTKNKRTFEISARRGR